MTIFFMLILMAKCAAGCGVSSLRSEPSYEREPLSFWLDELAILSEDAASIERKRAAEEAVREMGADALPHLLRMVHGNDRKRKDESASIRQALKAARGFAVLGESAEPAIPELLNAIEANPDAYDDWMQPVFQALLAIGPPALEAWTVLATHADVGVRRRALSAVANLEGNDEIRFKILVNALNERHWLVRPDVFQHLARQKPEMREKAIPFVIETIRDDTPSESAAYLEMFDAEERARPVIEAMLQDSDEEVRRRATNLLQHIEFNRETRAESPLFQSVD